MGNQYSEDKLEYMVDFISEYISKQECENVMINDYDCKHCDCINECYEWANAKCNSEWAESISYGGCNTEKEFWEQLFD